MGISAIIHRNFFLYVYKRVTNRRMAFFINVFINLLFCRYFVLPLFDTFYCLWMGSKKSHVNSGSNRKVLESKIKLENTLKGYGGQG